MHAIVAAAAFLIATAVNAPTHSQGNRARGTRTGVRDALTDAWRAPGFRRWMLASLISGAAVDVILVYQVPIMIAAGLPIAAAATIAGLRGFAQLAGRLPLSPLIGRFGAKPTVVLSFVTAGRGTAPLLASGWVPAAIAYSLLASASTGAIYTLQGIYTNELVAADNLSLLMGAQQACSARTCTQHVGASALSRGHGSGR